MLLTPDTLRRLCQARGFLREVPEEPLSIEELAREVRISPSHLTRLFDAAFGSTPHQFRIQSWLDRARSLLASGEYSVTDVWMDVGFSSLGSFSDLFTRRVGLSPSAYRRQVRAMIQLPGVATRQVVPGCLGLISGLPSRCSRTPVAT